MKRSFVRTVVVFAVVGLANLTSAQRTAQALPITFEGLSDLDGVTNQFAGMGVVFSNATALIDGSVGGSLNEIDFPPRSGVTVVIDDGGAMMLVFTTPFTAVSGFFTYNTQLILQAFSDSAGTNLIGSVTSAFADNTGTGGNQGSSPNEILALSGIGLIRSIKITGDPGGSSFVLDDFNGAPIPEPASLLLLGSGLGGAWLARRRKRR